MKIEILMDKIRGKIEILGCGKREVGVGREIFGYKADKQ
jgi:hypothetical protein